LGLGGGVRKKTNVFGELGGGVQVKKNRPPTTFPKRVSCPISRDDRQGKSSRGKGTYHTLPVLTSGIGVSLNLAPTQNRSLCGVGKERSTQKKTNLLSSKQQTRGRDSPEAILD